MACAVPYEVLKQARLLLQLLTIYKTHFECRIFLFSKKSPDIEVFSLHVHVLTLLNLLKREILLKIFAHGCYGYIKNALSFFDCFIVFIGLFEIVSSSANSGISVLRTFRLLMILKVFRFFKTLDSVATFGCILLLFIFIFSTLGMHLFGCKFWDLDPVSGECVVDRKNYDYIPITSTHHNWAFLVSTVYHTLTRK